MLFTVSVLPQIIRAIGYFTPISRLECMTRNKFIVIQPSHNFKRFALLDQRKHEKQPLIGTFDPLATAFFRFLSTPGLENNGDQTAGTLVNNATQRFL